MTGPGLPNPFDFDPTRRSLRRADLQTHSLDTVIADALRQEPLASPPPLLYAAVMQRVRQEPRPIFRLTWLDVALSLFAAGMLFSVWWAWRSLPPEWLNYMRLLAEYQLQKLWYLHFPLLAWVGLAAGLLLACLAGAATLLRLALADFPSQRV